MRGGERPLDGNADGVARCDVGAYELRPAAPSPPTIPALLIVGDTLLSAGDLALSQQLTDARFAVEVRDDATPISDFGNFLLVVVSETVDSTLLDPSLASARIPIVCMEPAFLDDLGMTGDEWDVDQGAAPGVTIICVAQPECGLPMNPEYEV